MTNDDKAEIIEIINLYAFALDTHQWDLFDRVFTEDVIAVFGPAGAGWKGLNSSKPRSRNSMTGWTATSTP